mgnify:CR=1 FL=1|tara:strand:+ start:987 stop:1169 length:183 start_codon:yes stop_codon:yes gene_type:complete
MAIRKETNFAMGSVRRIAKQISSLSDEKRREVLESLDTEMKLFVVEELVNLRIQNGRNKK